MLLMCTSALLVLSKELNVGETDIEKITFCFDSYDPNEAWETHYPWGGASTTIDGDVELLDENTCDDDDLGRILTVELRVWGYYYYSGNQRDIILRPVFRGISDGNDYHYQTTTNPWGCSNWFDITNDPSAPRLWTENDVQNLDCDVEAESGLGSFTLYYWIVQIRVIFT